MKKKEAKTWQIVICDYRGMEGGDRVDWCDRASCVVTEVSDAIYKKLVAEEIEAKDLLDMVVNTHRIDVKIIK